VRCTLCSRRHACTPSPAQGTQQQQDRTIKTVSTSFTHSHAQPYTPARNKKEIGCRNVADLAFFFLFNFFPPEHDFHFIQPKILVLMQRTRNFIIFMAFSRYFIVFLEFFPLTVITAVQQRFTFRFFGKTPMGLPPFIWKNLDLDFLFWNRHIDRQKSADSSFHWQLF